MVMESCIARLYVHMGKVTSGSADGSKTYTCATYCALVDNVSRVWGEKTLLFGHFYHAQCDTVFGGVPSTIEELGFGKNLAAGCV